MGFAADIGIALQFADVHPPVLLSFVNAFLIEEGGTHMRGFAKAVWRAIADYAAKTGSSGRSGHSGFIDDDITCGLAAVLSIWHPSPEFEGCARYRLMNPELERAVYKVTLEAFAIFAKAHPDQMRRIVEKCLKNRELRLHRQYGD
jgi:DNA gyrase subunit B